MKIELLSSMMWPLTTAPPSSAMRLITRRKVDLPQPPLPIRARICPACAVTAKSCSTTLSSMDALRFSTTSCIGNFLPPFHRATSAL